MQAPDPVETILARLMPSAVSEDCQLRMEEIIDELAGPEAEKIVPISSGKWIARSLIGGGIAAAIGALCAVFPVIRGAPDSPLVRTSTGDPTQGFVVVSESDRIESVTDEGWQEDSEGAAMHSVRFKAVQENNVRDRETGMIVRISEPREEILMMPVNEFPEASVLKKSSTKGMVEAAMVPTVGNGPLRVVNVAGKSASFSAEEGTATVHREGEGYQIEIQSPENGLIYAGELSKDGGLERIPEGWRRKIQVLCRTLDQALDGRMPPERQPRARVVPPPYPDR